MTPRLASRFLGLIVAFVALLMAWDTRDFVVLPLVAAATVYVLHGFVREMEDPEWPRH